VYLLHVSIRGLQVVYLDYIIRVVHAAMFESRETWGCLCLAVHK
jgi:hypothetical protein